MYLYVFSANTITYHSCDRVFLSVFFVTEILNTKVKALYIIFKWHRTYLSKIIF